MIVDTSDGRIVSAAEMIAANPLTCPTVPLQLYDGYAWLEDVPPPEYDPATHRVERLPVAVKSAKKWVPQYDVIALTQAEIAQRDAEQAAAEQAARDAARIKITRTQGLVYLFREYRVKESEVQGLIDAIEDPDKRYEADLYFKAATWDDDNEYVAMFAAAVGLVTPEIRKAAFAAAALL